MLSCPSNESYGHADAYRTYVGLNDWTPVDGRIQHGWSAIGAAPVGDRFDKQGIKFHIWSEKCKKGYYYADSVNLPIDRTYIVGAPILYIDPSNNIAGTGNLFVPSHSILDNKIAKEKWQAYVKFVKDSSSNGTILMHQRDIDLGYDKIVKEAGLNVVTVGHVRSIDFLHNLSIIILLHEKLISNCIQTVCFYALYLGRYVLVDTSVKTDHSSDVRQAFDRDWIRLNHPYFLKGTNDASLASPVLGTKKPIDFIKSAMFPHVSF